MNGLRQLLISLLPHLSNLAGDNAALNKALDLLRIVVQSDDAWEWLVSLLPSGFLTTDATPSFGAVAASCDEGDCPHEVRKFLDAEVQEQGYTSFEKANPEVGIGSIATVIAIVKLVIELWRLLKPQEASEQLEAAGIDS